jgi:DNA polymerase III alpha subunit
MSFDRAIAIRPDYADAHYNRAGLMGDLGRHEEAVAGYDMASRLLARDYVAADGTAHAPPDLYAYDADSRLLPARLGRTVRIAGMREAIRWTRTQAGRNMLFLTLDDEYGLFEATVFPDAAKALPRNFEMYGPYVVTGRVERQYDSVGITAERVIGLEETGIAKPQAATDGEGEPAKPPAAGDGEDMICQTRSNM